MTEILLKRTENYKSSMFSSPDPKGISELLPYQCVRRVLCPSTTENNYKTTGSTVLKFHMEHNLTPGSQICKIGSGRISKMAAVTKYSKITKSTSPELLDIYS